ncbi:MAG TPA: hypothetical protein DEQ64_16835 [Lachnoclostridium sp.]|uniref:hypothetical protein n=1 Tax=Lacrimispora sp. TaxID=2719234 RepID=UPI000EBEF1CF|nr:hypothetical protein [Lacrimispora sp.]HCD45358.1 hypothetical protein [Lachnoclostridium sp.]
MFERWTDPRKRENLRILLWIGLITVLLLLLSVAGSIRNEERYEEPGQDFTEVEKAEPEALAEPLSETLSDEIILSPGDKEFLTQLTGLFDQGDLEGAARLLNGYDIPWKEFPCMYDGAAMRGKISSGKGLVFVKASTVFYGNFDYGKPEGDCTALQVLELEEGKRYDYSYGTWADGKMNGNGECGYNYYNGVTEDITKLNAKRGAFKDDLMQGEITYTSTNAEGEAAVWQFKVESGVIVKDERWLQDTDSSGAVIYKLMAKDDNVHAYALGENAMGEDRWKNLILFPYV